MLMDVCELWTFWALDQTLICSLDWVGWENWDWSRSRDSLEYFIRTPSKILLMAWWWQDSKCSQLLLSQIVDIKILANLKINNVEWQKCWVPSEDNDDDVVGVDGSDDGDDDTLGSSEWVRVMASVQTRWHVIIKSTRKKSTQGARVKWSAMAK